MAIGASEARRNLLPLIERVNEDHVPVEIPSRKGSAVLISSEDYEALRETQYLLRAPANAQWLLESYGQYRRGVVEHRELDRDELLDDVLRDPTAGIGKPEPLRHMLPGTWSRRIDDEHRLVYVVDEDAVTVLAARYHHEQ